MAKQPFTATMHIKQDHFKQFGRQTHLGVERAAARLARLGQMTSRAEAPRAPRGRTPHLADAIEGRAISEGTHVVATVGVGKAWWGVFANQGTKPHTLYHGGQHPGQEGQHFLQKGLAAMHEAAHAAIRAELEHPR